MIPAIISSFGISDVFSSLIILIIIYATHYYFHYFTRLNPLPGPFPLPILGNLHQQGKLPTKDWMLLMQKKYGDIYEIYMAGQRSIILCNADLIKNLNIPTTKTKYPHRVNITEGYKEYRLDYDGIINNTDQKSWKYNRQAFSQAMKASNFSEQVIEWTKELWDEMDEYWTDLGKDYELDLIKWMSRFSNELIYKISTGIKTHSVTAYYYTFVPEKGNKLNDKEKEAIQESEKYMQAFDVLLQGYNYFFIFNKFMRHYVPFIRGKVISLLKNRDYCFDKLYQVVKNRRTEIENTPLDQPLRQDMLTAYITANTSRDINPIKNSDAELLRPMNNKDIFGNMLDTTGAGTEPLSNLICFIVYYLGHYPEVRRRLQQELDDVLGKDLTKPITNKDLENLHYCDAVIKEVYRHCPIAFSIGRVNIEKDTIGGYTWPEGTQFMMVHSIIMKRKEYWTDPEKFDPDRFYKTDESDKYLLEKRYIKDSFAMFGGGIRTCAGKKLALVELRFITASIYRKYDLEMVDVNAPLNYTCRLLLNCTELLIKPKPRKS